MNVVFLDIETTGLDVEKDQITEIAWITYDYGQRVQLVQHDRLPNDWVLRHTDYLTRIAPVTKEPLDQVLSWLRYDIERVSTTEPVYLVGACPAFDDRFLRKAYGEGKVPYHYHVIDIEAMAMGSLGLDFSPSLKDLRGLLGIEGQNEAPHHALADALEVKVIYEAITARSRYVSVS